MFARNSRPSPPRPKRASSASLVRSWRNSVVGLRHFSAQADEAAAFVNVEDAEPAGLGTRTTRQDGHGDAASGGGGGCCSIRA